MRRKVLLCLFGVIIIVLLAAGCGNEERESQNRSTEFSLELKKVDTFTIGGDTLTLDRVSKIPAVNRDESLMAWVNSDKNEIIVTDMRGKVVSTFGKKGKGPEEFSNISAIGFDGNDSIVIYDWHQDSFKKLGIDGKLLWIEKGLLKDHLWIRSDRIIYYNDHLYLGVQQGGASQDWKSKTVAEYNIDGQLSSLLGAYDPVLWKGDQELYTNINSITFDPATHKIFTTHRTLPYIQTYDLKTGKRLSRFGYVSNHFKISSDKARISDPRPVKNEKNLKQSFVGEGFVSDNYFFFHHFNWTEDFWRLRDPNLQRHFFNVFQKDKPHAFLGEIELPYAPMYVSSDNRVYLLEDDNPEHFTIGVYELSVK